MKRSEALSLIANQLDFLNGHFYGVRPTAGFTKEELAKADVILTTLEEAGMFPPKILSIAHAVAREDIVRAESQYFVNEWEKE